MSIESTHSEPFQRFVESLERGVQSKQDLEALDLDALSQIREDERGDVESMLASRLLAGSNDPRVVDALAMLDTDSGWKSIAQVARSGSPMARIRAAHALWRGRRDPAALDLLRQAALQYDFPIAAEEILAGLDAIGTDVAADVMLDMLERTRHDAVRTLIVLVLFRRYDFERHDRIATGPLWTLRLGLSSRFPSVRQKAFQELRTLIERRRAGNSDDQLAIVAVERPFSPEMSEILTASRDSSAPFKKDTLEALSGGERDWAVDLVIRALQRGEARAERALEILGGERGRLALDDWHNGRIDPE